jgi:hypothetical protein
MSAEEFGEWQAMYLIEPWGEWPADLRAGIIASTIANSIRTGNRKPYVVNDFMPLQQQRQQTDPDDIEPEEIFGKS